MPPRIRTRASKALKENIDSENKFKTQKSNTKVPRKALADKTNSASDDTSVEVPKKSKKIITKASYVEPKQIVKTKDETRPRRDRRLPTRFLENPVLVNLTNSKDNVAESSKSNTVDRSKPGNSSTQIDTPAKNKEPEVSPFKTPSKTETSLVVSRPRRICRLPSRFDDHSISPNKYIPIQPANASTPIQQKKAKHPPSAVLLPPENVNKETQNLGKSHTLTARPARTVKTAALQKKVSVNSSSDKSSPDTNNNPKARSARVKKNKPSSPSPKRINPKLNNNSIVKYLTKTISHQLSFTKKVSPKPVTNNKKPNGRNLSWKVLGDKKKSHENKSKSGCDVYEFTFDPDEEQQPTKKKRKKPITKKSKVTKPKAVVTYKSTYDQNILRAMTALKNAVKPSQAAATAKLPQIPEISNEIVKENVKQNNIPNIYTGNKENCIVNMNDTGKTSVHECNYPSIRVEDIAADIEPSADHIDHHDDLNYSPVNSPRPQSPKTSNLDTDLRQCPEKPVHINDPLNLQEDLSFFDDEPVASSSMNMSVRHPLASPWRVEFGSLPIKWHSNTYVKPNMTPAVESSFICSEESNKKKHVYTNMIPETNDPLPPIVSNTPSLKQTSIISFIKEVAEKKAKKKRGRSISPTKALFDNIDTNINTIDKGLNNKKSALKSNTSEEVSSSSNDASNDKENSKQERVTRKRKNVENICDLPAKSPRKQKDKDFTYFGFDDSENQDQENVVPIKGKSSHKRRSMRPRSRAVLQEINGPTRAALAVAAKSKTGTSSEAVNKVYEELKAAEEVPVFPDKNVQDRVTNIEDPSLSDDSQSVHLFEDIEVIHHLKPTRKSYGKAKKVTFRQKSTSDSESQEGIENHNSTFDDDLGDLTFEVPNVKEKKTKKKKSKKLMSKKEEKEAEEWAAGFNSMCEEIEEFPLVVE